MRSLVPPCHAMPSFLPGCRVARGLFLLGLKRRTTSDYDDGGHRLEIGIGIPVGLGRRRGREPQLFAASIDYLIII